MESVSVFPSRAQGTPGDGRVELRGMRGQSVATGYALNARPNSKALDRFDDPYSCLQPREPPRPSHRAIWLTGDGKFRRRSRVIALESLSPRMETYTNAGSGYGGSSVQQPMRNRPRPNAFWCSLIWRAVNVWQEVKIQADDLSLERGDVGSMVRKKNKNLLRISRANESYGKSKNLFNA